jgi:ATP-dependent DNA ligase
MLSENYKKFKNNLKFPAFAQLKIDGNRAIFKNNNFYSKSGKIINNTFHLTNELINCPFKLDGELYSFNLTFNELNGLCKLKQSVVNSKKTEKYLVFIVFDIITNESYKERFLKLQNYINNNSFKYIHLITSTIVESHHTIEELINSDLFIYNTTQKAEGLVLKNFDSYYTYTRSKNILKYKLKDDDEFKIISCAPSTKNYTIFTLLTTDSKYTFNAVAYFLPFNSSEMTSFHGKYATISFQNLDELSIPRFPICKCII